ncbi:hypothetical protein AtEden1_Chr4g0273171 [Arabidopsis thaliana]
MALSGVFDDDWANKAILESEKRARECEKDLLSYLLHGKHEIFSGLDKASADDTYRSVNNLWNSYPKDEEFERFGIPSKRGRDYHGCIISLASFNSSFICKN